jgi:transcriptional regulator with XRE-family HTH domain
VEQNSVLPREQARAARALLGWSQQDLARQAGVALSTVADFERGERTPVPNNMDAIRSALEKGGVSFAPGETAIAKFPDAKQARIGGSPIRWVDATDLSHWADRRDGQDTMPELISRLIRASKGHSAHLCFPSADSVSQPGWDGLCEVDEGTEHIPSGRSAWEIGTQRQKIRDKADKEYEKRSTETNPAEASRTTFVFVSARRWPRKSAWVRAKASDGLWAEVRAYDANNIVHWLELFPQVGLWLAVRIGKRPNGIRDLGEVWREWALSTKWPMNSEILLAGRDEEAARILRWLYAEPSVLTVHADSTREAIAFLQAATDQLPVNYRAIFQSRALLSTTPDAARTLGDSLSSLIIILDEAEAGLAVNLAQKGHHVFLATSSETGPSSNSMHLPRPRADAFVRSLEGMGMPKQEAERLSRDSARSLSVLRRLIPAVPSRLTPEWAKPENAREFVPALLVGAWDESEKGDKEVIERLSGMTYDEMAARLVRWLNVPDNPLRKVGTAWKLSSPRDVWFSIAPYLTSADLERFSKIAVDVLGSRDPRFQMEPDKRWLAAAHGCKPEYSRLLRTGITEALALLSVFGDRARSVTDSSQRVDLIVQQLLDGADAERWWSLSPHLVTLAEASPEAFLSALDESLSQASPAVMALFNEDPGPLGAAHHSELLWGLELLAWSRNYLARVSELLAIMSRLDPPGGKYQNRPSESLVSIFRLWMPQTSATLDERFSVLNRLRTKEPKEAWRLMLSLLPHRPDFAIPTPQARWRDFSASPEENVTNGLIARGAKLISSWLLEDTKSDELRWKDVFEVLPNMATEQRKEAVDQFLKEAPKIADDETLEGIEAAIRSFLHSHRAFSDAKWALPTEEIDYVEKAYAAAEPRDKIRKISWLFSNIGVPLPRPASNDWKADHESSGVLRREALRGLVSNGTADEIFTLASKARMPALVGVALVEAHADEAVEDAILSRAINEETETNSGIAIGMIAALITREGTQWTEEFLGRVRSENWPPRLIIRLLLLLPPSGEVWKHAREFGKEVEEPYWAKVRGFFCSDEDAAFVTEKLLNAGRPHDAVNVAGQHIHRLTGKLIARVLSEAAAQPFDVAHKANDLTMFTYYVEEMLQRLDDLRDVSRDQIANLEWTYLPFLEHSRRPPIVLHEWMSSNPSFFVEVLSAIYRPASSRGAKDDNERDQDKKRAIATHAYHLLHSWHRVPGESNGIIDSAKLQSWIKDVRELATNADRLNVADEHIGSVLASSPNDPDGAWPAKPVRQVIESLRSHHLESGINMGIHNKQGVTCRAPYDGGNLERSTATCYRNWAESTKLEWTRTSALLERIAKSFEEFGRWHDQDAERMDWNS